jgi:MEDS: MEthanogen/methylotroph, DcmR Sensory domain
VLPPFIKDGFERGEKAIHVISPDQQCDHLQRLAAVGIDPAVAQQSGQLDLRVSTEAYLRNGRFDQDRMLEVFEQLASSTVREGFKLSRIICHMEWAADDRTHIDNLVEFESRVNDVWSRSNDAVICVYDLAKFGGDTVVDIIRTHPVIIIGGILQQNPFFVPPGQFLRELRDRRTRQTARSSTAV